MRIKYVCVRYISIPPGHKLAKINSVPYLTDITRFRPKADIELILDLGIECDFDPIWIYCETVFRYRA